MSNTRIYSDFLTKTVENYISHVESLEAMNHDFTAKEVDKLKKIKKALKKLEINYINDKKKKKTENKQLKNEINDYKKLQDELSALIDKLDHKHEGTKVLKLLNKIHDEIKMLKNDLTN